jgi:PilZ domain
MDERRKATRRRVLKSGTIEFATCAYSCAVRNLSDHGAALDLPDAIAMPLQFELVMETNQMRRHCHVIWRKENRLGVAFG